MGRILSSLLVLCIWCSGSVFAGQGYHWDFAGWYGGGCFSNIAFDPKVKDRVYMTSDVAGIWRSDDGGDHWHFINKGLGQLLVAELAVAPSDSNVLYASTKTGMYYSLDAGGQWNKADTVGGKMTFERPANYKSIAVDPSDPPHVCVGTSKGDIYCSSNYGKAWTLLAPPSSMNVKKGAIPSVFFGGGSADLYVAFPRSLVRYSQKTAAWASLGEFKGITDAFLDEDTGTLYIAAENKVWTKGVASEGEWQSSRPIPRGNVYRIALAGAKENRRIYVDWLAGWDGWVTVSDNGGQSWQDLGQNLHADAASNPSRVYAQKKTKGTALKVDPFNPQRLFRTDFWGAWRSDDGGESWQERIVGAPNTVVTDVTTAANGDIYVSSMDNGLMRSRDGGKTYKALFPSSGYAADKNGHVWRVALAGTTIVGTSSPWNAAINQVIVSDNDGKTFDLVRNGIPAQRPHVNTMWGQGYPRALAVDPKDPDTVYLGIDGDDGGGLFVSHDRGRNWKRNPGQPDALRVFKGLSVDPTDSKRILWGACGKWGGVYVSTDAGKSFRLRETAMTWVFDTAIGRDGTMYAAGDSNGAKLFYSTDHGLHWKMMHAFAKDRALAAVAVSPVDPKTIVAGEVSWPNAAPNHVHMTRDGGKTWVDITGDLPDGAGVSSITFDVQGRNVYIGRTAGSVYRMALPPV